MIDFSEAEKQLGVAFQNRNLLLQALTHRSYLNEDPSWRLGHNERLEFIGDAVLELIVTENLFKQYPEKDEGILTAYRSALVNGQMLSEAAKELGLEKFLLFSRGEAKSVGRAREIILANAFEALIGALYLDSGYWAVKDFIDHVLMHRLKEVLEKEAHRYAKSVLQERTQEKLKITPAYKVLKENGPDHDKEFVVGVFVGNKLVAEGTGHSKKEAEIQAAEKALKAFI